MFKFRLEKVMQVRQIMEEKRKQEWALQENAVHQARAKLEHLLDHKDEIMQFGYRQVDLQIRTSMYSYLHALDRKIKVQQLEIERCEEQAALTKKVWLTARQEEEKIVTLKERHHTEYLKEKERREQKVLDDMRSHLKSV